MADAAKKAGVKIATGDTKVVPRGKADKIFINTSGIGLIPKGVKVSGSRTKSGDKIIINGTIADYGITILSTREGLKFMRILFQFRDKSKEFANFWDLIPSILPIKANS